MKKYKKPRSVKTPVSEPPVSYGNDALQRFTSFEEMNESDLREMASYSPMQRLAHVTALLKQFYSAELKSKFSDLTIHFKAD